MQFKIVFSSGNEREVDMTRIFINIKGENPGQSPVSVALKQVISLLTDCEFVDKLLDDENEADLAIVSSSSDAMHIQKETESTIIAVVCWKKEELELAKAFATRSDGRIRAIRGVQALAELIAIIGEISKK